MIRATCDECGHTEPIFNFFVRSDIVECPSCGHAVHDTYYEVPVKVVDPKKVKPNPHRKD